MGNRLNSWSLAKLQRLLLRRPPPLLIAEAQIVPGSSTNLTRGLFAPGVTMRVTFQCPATPHRLGARLESLVTVFDFTGYGADRELAGHLFCADWRG
jgi:hypothetical protein